MPLGPLSRATWASIRTGFSRFPMGKASCNRAPICRPEPSSTRSLPPLGEVARDQHARGSGAECVNALVEHGAWLIFRDVDQRAVLAGVIAHASQIAVGLRTGPVVEQELLEALLLDPRDGREAHADGGLLDAAALACTRRQSNHLAGELQGAVFIWHLNRDLGISPRRALGQEAAAARRDIDQHHLVSDQTRHVGGLATERHPLDALRDRAVVDAAREQEPQRGRVNVVRNQEVEARLTQDPRWDLEPDGTNAIQVALSPGLGRVREMRRRAASLDDVIKTFFASGKF